jgi:hypothetical protein
MVPRRKLCMAARAPTPEQNPAELITRRIAPGATYHHIFVDRHPDPLGFGLSPSRFSDPRLRVKRPYGVYYVGGSFEVAFLETLVRDRRNYNPGPLVVSLDELHRYVHVPIIVESPLNLVDLQGGNAIAMGIPTDALRASSHRAGQRVSLSLYRHPEHPDGISYTSRLNEGDNFAVFDHAIPKLRAGPRRAIDHCPELAPLLDRYRIILT